MSLRLDAIAGFVRFRTLADVGTDHAQLPVKLVKAGKIDRAIASDVNAKPLENARQTIEKHGFLAQIETRLSNGLDKIAPGEAEALVISGMGGELIAAILAANPEVAANFSQLILQPQADVALLRRFLHGAGFRIRSEELVFEKNFYFILDCEPGTEDIPYSDTEYELSRHLMAWKPDVFVEYLKILLQKKRRILASMKNMTTNPGRKHLEQRTADELEMLIRACSKSSGCTF